MRRTVSGPQRQFPETQPVRNVGRGECDWRDEAGDLGGQRVARSRIREEWSPAVRVLCAAFGAAVALLFALPWLASADEIVNDLDSSADLAFETMTLAFEGQSTTLRVRVTNDDGRNGCNFGARGNPSLVIAPLSSDLSVATVAPASLTFDACGEHQQVQVTAVGAGTAQITFQEIANSTAGSFNLGTGAFTVIVARPPTATRIPTSTATPPPTATATAVPSAAVVQDVPLVASPTAHAATATLEAPPATATATRTPLPLGGGVGSLGGGGGSFGGGNPPNPAQTPELGSLLLFGSGAAGMAAYGLARLRSRRQH